MEEKPPAASGGGGSPASAEPASSSRRRASGQKRKAATLSTSSNTSSTPSKRFTREKAAISQIPIHNSIGPLTRAARQSPGLGNLNSGGNVRKVEEKVPVAVTAAEAAAKALEEEEMLKMEELKAKLESEYEKIRSRDSNSHVVPSHCGWFSWTKIHPLEERVLPSFFNGKSQTRTPDTYMEIRNKIVIKFHANPNVQIELKDLSEFQVADTEAKQEVFEFLDYWGLINFHPFLKDSPPNDTDEASKKEDDSVIEKLFRFESIQQPCNRTVGPKPSTVSAAPILRSSGLFPESSITEESANLQAEGHGVEYHCNSCSADCSRKRYHCQTQADYDLCVDCFNNGKFDSDMASSDFILMDHADTGISGGKWTDQETLLLLEALELFKENWNEIAEHVATKTKAQCILHFVQMPIEDIFFDSGDDLDGNSKETKDPPAAKEETAAKDGTETSDDKTGSKEDKSLASPMEDTIEVKEGQEAGKSDNASEAKDCDENTNSKDTSDVKADSDTVENVALKALTEAFEGVGYALTSENRLSFADVGNPAMALASFLGRLVGKDVATASAQISMKSLNTDSPGMHLAARHCFILEDPPDDLKELASVDCSTTEMVNQDAHKDKQDDQTQKAKDSPPNDPGNKKIEDSAPEEKQPPDSSNEEPNKKVKVANGAGDTVSPEETQANKSKESKESKAEKKSQKNTLKDYNEISSKSECPSSSKKETEGSKETERSQPSKGVSKAADSVSDLKSSEKNEPCQPVEQPSQSAEVSKDVEMVSGSLPSESNEQLQKTESNSVVDQSNPTEATKDVDMLPSETIEPQQPVALKSAVDNGANAAEDQKDYNTVKPDRKDVKDDDDIDKLKRAAVCALSAAAVKAKLLANQEEDHIRQLSASMIEKQMHKLETKLAFFNEMDHVILRAREQLERSRQKLFHERAQIIAARLGIPPSSSRPMMQPALSANRIAMNFSNSIPRPPMNVNALRPPISRPMDKGATPLGRAGASSPGGSGD